MLQSSHQWAYDPTSAQKPASEILSNLILLASKNGNYLVNGASLTHSHVAWPPFQTPPPTNSQKSLITLFIHLVAPSPQGPWADTAVTVLEQLAAWFQVNGEAIQGTDPMYPSSDSGAYLTSRNKTVYIIVPSTPPDRTDGTTSQLWAALHGQARHPFVAQDTSNLTLP